MNVHNIFIKNVPDGRTGRAVKEGCRTGRESGFSFSSCSNAVGLEKRNKPEHKTTR